ncbi:hypothetical protein ATKI12_0250 [Kitasatospora sp. Ki12]
MLAACGRPQREGRAISSTSRCAVMWVPRNSAARFIDADTTFPPILEEQT